MTAPAPPDGFTPHFRKSEFTDPWEPIFSQVENGTVRLAVMLNSPHCNSRGFVHGGLIASLADNAMGLSCATQLREAGREIKGLITVSLNTEFLGAASLGSWLIVEPDHVKLGGSLAFGRCLVHADGKPVAQASASFKIT
ncbi:MAG: PaaI family thioesterase [Hyphomonadaceae bacterium]|nr:PaaI family thioesterase [Hyphomonadaceae bacterium]